MNVIDNLARRSIVAALFGLRAGIFIYVFGERLTPDTYRYAHASGWWRWSSPLCAFAGYAYGINGVRIVGLFGAMAVGWICGNLPISRILIVGILPPGWYTIQAAADAIGAALAGWSDLKWRRIPIVYLGHLQAALTCGFVRITHRWIGDFAFFAAGAISCLSQWHFQMRYFLPGVVLWALKGGKIDLLRYRATWSRKKLLRLQEDSAGAIER